MLDNMNKFVPAVYDGIPLEGYWVHKDTGEIWSTEKGAYKQKNPTLCSSTGYYKSHFKCYRRGRMYLYWHKVVAETLVKFPVPEGVTKKDWDITPLSVKRVTIRGFLVNHKDHNRQNYNPSNLEFVDHRGNAKAYQEFSRSN